MIEFTASTHPGNRYQHNEDAMGWSEPAGLWFVADGMGGHARGDIASATVKSAILGAVDLSSMPLSDLVLLAHDAVVEEGIERDLPNMGSTVVIARVKGNQLTVGWCGDSRAYLWRSGQLVRITRDHSLLEQLLESGVVAPEEAFGHPRRNVLIQALGINEPRPTPSEVTLTLDNDDLVLLCSDGIHDELPDGTIADILQALQEPQAIVDELERRVLSGDARDNLTVLCLRVSGLEDTSSGALNVVDVRDQLKTSRRSAQITRQRIVDTLELPAVAARRTTATADIGAAAGGDVKAQGNSITREGRRSGEELTDSKFGMLRMVGIGLMLLAAAAVLMVLLR